MRCAWNKKKWIRTCFVCLFLSSNLSASDIMKLCKKIPAKNFYQDHVLFLQGYFWLWFPNHACAWNRQCRFSCDCLWNPDVGILVRNIGQFCRMSRFSVSYFSSSIAHRQVCNWSKIAYFRSSFFFSELEPQNFLSSWNKYQILVSLI